MENSRYGVYNKVEDKPEYYYKYTDDQYQTNVKVGALLNLAYLNGKNRYYFRNIFNQIGQDKLTLREGWQNMSSLYIQEKTEYCYTSRSTYSGQIAGVHTLELGIWTGMRMIPTPTRTSPTAASSTGRRTTWWAMRTTVKCRSIRTRSGVTL